MPPKKNRPPKQEEPAGEQHRPRIARPHLATEYHEGRKAGVEELLRPLLPHIRRRVVSVRARG